MNSTILEQLWDAVEPVSGQGWQLVQFLENWRKFAIKKKLKPTIMFKNVFWDAVEPISGVGCGQTNLLCKTKHHGSNRVRRERVLQTNLISVHSEGNEAIPLRFFLVLVSNNSGQIDNSPKINRNNCVVLAVVERPILTNFEINKIVLTGSTGWKLDWKLMEKIKRKTRSSPPSPLGKDPGKIDTPT